MNQHQYQDVAANLLEKIHANALSLDEFQGGQALLNLAATRFEVAGYFNDTGRMMTPAEVDECRREAIKIRELQTTISKALFHGRTALIR